MKYKKIAIIGITASGKSTLSLCLSQKTGLPVFHVDTFLWKGNWKEVPRREYLSEHDAAVEMSEWIIEGKLEKGMAERLRKAELVLYLDYPGIVCFWQSIDRWWKYRKRSRPELPREAVDTFDPKLFLRTLTRAQRKEIEEIITISKPARLIRLHSHHDLDRFIAEEFGFQFIPRPV